MRSDSLIRPSDIASVRNADSDTLCSILLAIEPLLEAPFASGYAAVTMVGC